MSGKARRIRLACPSLPSASCCPPRLLAAVTTLACSLPFSVNTPPYPALPVIWSMFPCLPDLDPAPTERGGAVVHDGTWLVEGLLAFLALSPSSFFTLYLSLRLWPTSVASHSSLLVICPASIIDLL